MRFAFLCLSVALAAAGAGAASSPPPQGDPAPSAPACKQCANWTSPGALTCFGKSLCQPKNACEECSRAWCEAKLGRKLDCGDAGAVKKAPEKPPAIDTRTPKTPPAPPSRPIQTTTTDGAGGTVVVTSVPGQTPILPPHSDPQGPASDDWIHMFDGSSLTGWQANEHPESWTVRDGAIVGSGETSHLFWMVEQCENCEFRARVRISRGGNSGLFFRARFAPGFPQGYEAQIANSNADWRKTGSLFGIVNITDQLVRDETWFTQEVAASGPHIVIKVNGNTVVDYTDPQRRYTKGWLALQIIKGATVEFQDLAFRRLTPQ